MFAMDTIPVLCSLSSIVTRKTNNVIISFGLLY